MKLLQRENEDQCKFGDWFLVVGKLKDIDRGKRGMVTSVYPGGIIAEIGHSDETIRREDLPKLAFEIRTKII